MIEDIATSKVAAMDALLLAENGYAVPENNITYEDSQIEYDPDFDEIEWGKPLPFQKMQEILTTLPHTTDTTQVNVVLNIKNGAMNHWFIKNQTQINLIFNKLIEGMYQAENLKTN